MQAKDVMTTAVVTIGPNITVQEIARLLLERQISAVPGVDAKGRLVGIVSEGDLMRRPESGTERLLSWWLSLLASSEEQAHHYLKARGLRAADVMTRGVVTVAEDTPLDAIATLLERHHIKRVPVMRFGALVGIVSRANLLHGLIACKEVTPQSTDDRLLRVTVLQAIGATGAGGFINAVVKRGTAYLFGAVESKTEKDAARVAAERVPGVARVVDEIGVFPPMFEAGMRSD
jgi:CBS domain-containing protein